MNRFVSNSFLSLLIAVSLISCTGMESDVSSAPQTNDARGNLVIVGGGGRPLSVMNKIVELSSDSSIIIIPMASSIPDTVGFDQGEQFWGYGAKSVEVLLLTETDKSNETIAEKLRNARGIWFSGGDQNRLMDYLGDGILIDALFEAYQNGAVISGTSAGAAVMSKVMLTGSENRPDRYRSNATIHKDNIITTEGIGLLQGVIVDQHFLRRSRLNRLISTLLDHPERLAAGIDEATALWIKPGGWAEVIGESQVILLEEGTVKTAVSDTLYGASGIRLSVLPPGSTFRIQGDAVTDLNVAGN